MAPPGHDRLHISCEEVAGLLPSSPSNNDNPTTIKHLQLSFYLTDPYLRTIGHAVGNVVQSGKTDCLEFTILADVRHPEYEQCVLFGQRFMSFVQECHAAFRWLTRLVLENLTFGHTDIHNLLHTCNKLELLSLTYCDAVIHPVTGEDAVLTIDAPHSSLLALEITICGIKTEAAEQGLNWICTNPPLCFGSVPSLDILVLRPRCPALNWQTPFRLSHCLSNTTSLSTLYLNFCDQMIWIEPEGPKHISPKFSNLKDVYLYNIFYDCDLNWTMFILEAAPSLNNFYLMLFRHPCEKSRFEDIAEKVNVLWDQASPGFKHHRLNVLQMAGFVIDEKLIKYIRLVMERAVGLKRIRLLDQHPCTKCEAIYNGQPPSPVRWSMEIPGRGRGEETNKAATSRWLLLFRSN
ncbi:hypothetical protein EJB05_34499, partial [Eragrostis curvula]